MEKDWKEKKQILNAEIRSLIIARLLSCVVIAGLLLGVLPFWAAILLVGVMWNVNFIVGGSIIYEYDLLVFLGDNKLGAIMVVAYLDGASFNGGLLDTISHNYWHNYDYGSRQC